MSSSYLDAVKFDSNGLIPAIAQEHSTGNILMVAWMTREALAQTVDKKQAVYWSRSRGALWHKGETSGHFQIVHDIRLDCDGDVIVLQVTQVGDIACHTGRHSCFYQTLTADGWKTVEPVLKDPATIYAKQAQIQQPSALALLAPHADSGDVLETLGNIIVSRKSENSDTSYVASLYSKGLNKILEKVGEECVETIIAAKDANITAGNNTDDLVYETADLWFHTLVMLGHFNISPKAVVNELARRFNVSGLEEKASRLTQ